MAENIEIVPLYFAAPRPTYIYEGGLFMADDLDRLKKVMGHKPEITIRSVRFRTLGCSPADAALWRALHRPFSEVIQEMLLTTTSERQGRVIDKDEGGAGMEKKKQEGYF